MMVIPARLRCLLVGLLLVLAAPVRAQEAPPLAERYAAERDVVVSALQTVLSVIQEITTRHASGDLGSRLRAMRHRLTGATIPLGRDPGPASPARETDLRELERLLRDLYRDLRALRHELEDREDFALADRLYPLEQSLRDALRTVRRLATDDGAPALAHEPAPERTPRVLAERDRRRDDDARFDEDWSDFDFFDDEDDKKDWPPRRWRGHHDWDDPYMLVGEVWSRWPYPATALYRPIPSVRYNRVEGLVLGIGRGPLAWDSYRRARLFGQVSYAFGLDRFRYEAALEVRLGPRYGNDALDAKLGGAYRRQTTTNDLWKTTWAENTAVALFDGNDFFDYFETEGWTIYTVAHLTPYVQVSAGFRQEAYRSLENTTTWSLFGGSGLRRRNPPVVEGDMNTVVLALEGGRIRDFDDRPRGAGFRLEAELGDGLGGDFSFNRYTGDLRLYLLAADFGFNLRLRGGLATGSVPFQKAFTLGGIGSVRAYPQNGFVGTRALLANAELAFYEGSPLDDLLWDELQVFGLFDAGWVNDTGTDTFRLDDVLPAAGFGIGLDDRHVRLEVVWPLRDRGTGTDPTLWLRFAPAF